MRLEGQIITRAEADLTAEKFPATAQVASVETMALEKKFFARCHDVSFVRITSRETSNMLEVGGS